MKHILFTTLLAAAGNVFVFGQAPKDTIRIMRPDHMPCLVPNLAKVERMPMKPMDLRLIRPMPNGAPDPGAGGGTTPMPGLRLKPMPMPGPKIEMVPPKRRKWQ